MKVLVLGATGLVGAAALRRAIDDTRVEQVIAPTRRDLPRHAKLMNPVAPVLDALLDQAADWKVDAVICAMGTTIGKAGSKQAFRHVDYVLPLAFAKLAHRQGAESFALVSSPGASLSIPLFYCRVKGELERDIGAVGFNALTIVRPGLIGGHRAEFRLAERVALALETVFHRFCRAGCASIRPTPSRRSSWTRSPRQIPAVIWSRRGILPDRRLFSASHTGPPAS